MPEPATRASWKTLPEPEARAWFDLPMTFTQPQTDKLRRGHIPEMMEDKWFVFHEAGWLTFCRSWTGACIFGVQLEPSPDKGAHITTCWASRDAGYYSETDLNEDRRLLRGLIDYLLEWDDGA